jgi:maltose O-acetyltransferase
VRVILARCFAIAKRAYWSVEYQGFRERYQVDPRFRFNGEGILLYGRGEIIAGPDSYIGSYSSINAQEGITVRIGRGCSLSHDVRIYSGAHVPDGYGSGGDHLRKRAPVVIGDDVFVGYGTYIGPGVTIGDGAFIAANSVITRDVEPGTIAGGSPAQVFRAKRDGGLPHA